MSLGLALFRIWSTVSNSSGFERWLMSPVCNMNSGAAVSPLILSTAAFSVTATSGLAGLLNPIWLSLICTKLSSPLASAVFNSERRLRLYDFNTPPCITQRAPVPAQAMHFRKPRRLTPSLLWSCKSSSFFFSDILTLLVNHFPHPSLGVPLRTAARDWGSRARLNSTCFVYQDRRTSPFIPDSRAHLSSVRSSLAGDERE